MNVKKILIIIGVVIVIIAAALFTVDRLQSANRQRVVDAVQSGLNDLAELERQQSEINRGFERTIAEQGRLLAERQGIIDRRNDTIKQRESELDRTNELIERLSDSGGSEQGSLDSLGEIYRELRRRNNENREQVIILEENNLD